MIVEVEVHKGDHGFGIYFTRDESRVLVEGFVRAEDGTAGPAEDAGTIAVDDVLEQINGLDITHMAMVDVIYQLRAAPKGPNLLTFRRRDEHPCSDPCECTAQVIVSNNDNIDEKLQAAEDAKWSASILSEAEFCDHLYAESDAQHKSYLRQQYPVLMAKFQASFDTWPTPVLSCEPTMYSNVRHTTGMSSIAPSTCLRGLLECVRVKFGWTRGEIQGLMRALQAQHDVESAVDLVCALRQAGGHALALHRPPASTHATVKFPRMTKAMWELLAESAMHAMSTDELALVNATEDGIN